MIYYFSYPISMLLLLWNFFIKTLMTSETPPLFSVNEMRDYYISSALMLLFYLFTLKSGSKSVIKLTLALIPVLIMLILETFDIINKLMIINYPYYTTPIILMDLTYEIVLICLFVYGIYYIKKLKAV